MTGPTRGDDASDARGAVDDRARRVASWLAALDARHRQPLRPSEFNKAVRALSARYVERRGELPRRSPIDSAGKRAAFAGFYAPLHFVTVQRILDALRPATPATTVVDLGCGTGVAGAAWALASDRGVRVVGVDADAWALAEARWTWRALGLDGRAVRGDLVAAAARAATSAAPPVIVAGWSVNELDDPARTRLLPHLGAHVARGGGLLIVEPIARRATPWWDAWVSALAPHGARADEWSFDADLPATLAAIDEASGFRRDGIKARSIHAPCGM